MSTRELYRRKPVPELTTDWHHAAACVGEDVGLFFPADGEHPIEKQRREVLAIAICDTCPVRQLCRDDALTRRDLHGVRGGMGPDDLARAYRSRMRAGLIPSRRRAA